LTPHPSIILNSWAKELNIAGPCKGHLLLNTACAEKGRDNFFDLVKKCYDPVKEIILKWVRLMARCAWSYICTYLHNRIVFHSVCQSNKWCNASKALCKSRSLLFTEIESLVTKF